MNSTNQPKKKFRLLRPLFRFAPKKFKSWFKFKILGETGTLVNEKQLKPKMKEACVNLIKSVGKENIGDYLEFGVYNGTSLGIMNDILQEFKVVKTRLFGFDSFEGLPQEAAIDDKGVWKPGTFHCTEKIARQHLTKKGINWAKTFLIKGWFSNTLTNETKQQYNIEKASIIMMDCDIYSSTCEALNFCTPLIKDKTFIIFDDWNSHDLADQNLGEKKAFDEFLQSNPNIKAEDFGSYSFRVNPNGKMFLLTNTKA